MEKEFNWNDLKSEQQEYVCMAHSTAYGKVYGITVNTDTMYRVFNLGSPNVIIGDKSGTTYCRIARNSIEIMKLLINQYVLK